MQRGYGLSSILLSLTFTLSGCVNENQKTEATHADAKPVVVQKPATAPVKEIPAEPTILGPNARAVCKRPASIQKNPETIEDVITLLNALPKPVTAACMIDTLDGPLQVNATSNVFSGQPANGIKNPRIFLFLGPSLIMSVVPDGMGSKVVEFGFRLGHDESVKGELEFPVTETLAADAAYTHILSRNSNGTICGSCHFSEGAAPDPFPPTAFVSRLVPAMDDYDVPVDVLQDLNAGCKTKVGDHCPLIQALFLRGKVQAKSFE